MDDQLKHCSDKLAYEIDSWDLKVALQAGENITVIDARSTKGALNMLRLGFRVKELIGGLDWWKRDGHKTHAGAVVEKSVTCGCGSTS